MRNEEESPEVSSWTGRIKKKKNIKNIKSKRFLEKRRSEGIVRGALKKCTADMTARY